LLTSVNSWKIRFLIRVHKFLSYIHRTKASETSDKGKAKETEETENSEKAEHPEQPEQPELIEEFQLKRIKFQMERIKTSVENIVRYLAKALLEPPLKKTTKTAMMPDHCVAGESNYYYVMMTIWYVWNYFHDDDPGWTFDWAGQLRGKEGASSTLLGPHRLPPDEWTFATADRDKVQLLQWYHYGSLLKLCENGVLDKLWKGPSLDAKVRRLANAAKMVSSAKLSSREPYVADDEIFDRLSFVSDELHLEKLRPTDPGVVASLSIKRVKGRDFTRILNPGWLPKNVEESTSSPWEIHALCHHSCLVALTKEEKTGQDWRTREHTHSEAEGFRKDICTFLNAEGTLIPCWERAHAKYRKGWLRSEATPVVGTTLIIILHKTMELASKIASEAEKASAGDGSSPSSPTNRAQSEWPQTLAKWPQYSMDHEKRIIREVRHLGGLMKGQLDAFERFTNEPGFQPPIVWKSFRPPCTYHPDSFTNSLEDTPQLYKYAVLSKRPMPLSLDKKVLDRPDKLKEDGRDFRKTDIKDIFDDKGKTKKLLFLVDIKAIRNEKDDQEFAWEIKNHQYNEWTECEDEIERKEKIKHSKALLVWALYDNVSNPCAVLIFTC
jgi:hypothetical protein